MLEKKRIFHFKKSEIWAVTLSEKAYLTKVIVFSTKLIV